MKKRLYKSKNDRKLFGVCAGIAEYFNIDPTIVRVLWAVFALAYGSGILAYFLAAFILPEAPDVIDVDADVKESEEKKKYTGPEID